MKFGGEFDRVGVDDIFGSNQFGNCIIFGSDPNYLLDALTPGGSIPNRFEGPGLYLRQSGNVTEVMDLGHAALFAADSWRVAPNLTLDLGFRWSAQYNDESLAGNQDLVGRVRGVSFPVESLDPTYIPDATRQFMPRFGFAYSPGSSGKRTVVRGGVGLFCGTSTAVWFNAPTKPLRSPSFNLSVNIPTTGATVYQQFLAAGIDLNAYPLNELPVFPIDEIVEVLDGDPWQGASPRVIHSEFANPRSTKFTLGAEHALTDRMVLGFQAMHQRNANLQILRDYNPPPPQVRQDDPAGIAFCDIYQRPSPTLGPVVVAESTGFGRYTGATASWKCRGDRLDFATHYTYARAYSSSVNENNPYSARFTDHGRPEDECGPSSLDMRHQLTSHVTWSLPGGLTWSGIIRTTSAPPVSPAAGTDLNGDTFSRDRALERPGKFFGRNTFRNRGMRNVDMRLLKALPFGERRSPWRSSICSTSTTSSTVASTSSTVRDSTWRPVHRLARTHRFCDCGPTMVSTTATTGRSRAPARSSSRSGRGSTSEATMPNYAVGRRSATARARCALHCQD